MSDNPMCELCLLREDAVACWHSDCGVFSVVEYCGIPAICLELKCWEAKRCDFPFIFERSKVVYNVQR